MNEFLEKISKILEQDSIRDTDELKSFEQWDSLSVLSVIAMLDSSYGVNLRATDVQQIGTAGDLWNLVQSKKRS